MQPKTYFHCPQPTAPLLCLSVFPPAVLHRTMVIDIDLQKKLSGLHKSNISVHESDVCHMLRKIGPCWPGCTILTVGRCQRWAGIPLAPRRAETISTRKAGKTVKIKCRVESCLKQMLRQCYKNHLGGQVHIWWADLASLKFIVWLSFAGLPLTICSPQPKKL